MVEKLFDIIVPTFNRYKELPEFFEKNRALAKSNADVWIIDDCSPSVDRNVIPDWPNLHFIQLEKNGGQAFARNIAIANGNSPFIISMDDDAWFTDADSSLIELDKLFKQHPDAGCIMFNVKTPDSDYSSMPSNTRIPLHVTCGCAYRREALKQINGFSGFLHSQAEETDISIRLYKKKWSIYFSSEIRVFHNFDPADRSLSWYYRARYNTTRNDLLIVLMYYPSVMTVPFLAGKFASHLLYTLRNKGPFLTSLFFMLKAGFGFLRLAPIALRNRSALTMQEFKDWRSLLLTQKNLAKTPA